MSAQGKSGYPLNMTKIFIYSRWKKLNTQACYRIVKS